MPVVGERKNSQKINRNYANDDMHAVAEEFLNVARGALQESGVDIFTEPQKFFMHNSTKNDLKQFFMNEMYDPNDPEMKDPEKIEDFEESLDNLFQKNKHRGIFLPRDPNQPGKNTGNLNRGKYRLITVLLTSKQSRNI